jgi:hypothetical protein
MELNEFKTFIINERDTIRWTGECEFFDEYIEEIKKSIEEERIDILDILCDIHDEIFGMRILEYKSLEILKKYISRIKKHDLLIAQSIYFGFYEAVQYLSTISDIKEGIGTWASRPITTWCEYIDKDVAKCLTKMITDKMIKWDDDIPVKFYKGVFGEDLSIEKIENMKLHDLITENADYFTTPYKNQPVSLVIDTMIDFGLHVSHEEHIYEILLPKKQFKKFMKNKRE